MTKRSETGEAPASPAPGSKTPPRKSRGKRPSLATHAARTTRPEISRDAIARLMSLSPDRPHYTVGDVIHRLKRSAPSLPGSPLSSSTRPPR
jgi:hypothetical protein